MSFARNCHFTIKTGKAGEFNRLMNGDVLPLLRNQKGFQQNMTFLEGSTGTSISVWDDRACGDTYNTKTYPEVLKALEPVLEGTPRVDTYDNVVLSTLTTIRA